MFCAAPFWNQWYFVFVCCYFDLMCVWVLFKNASNQLRFLLVCCCFLTRGCVCNRVDTGAHKADISCRQSSLRCISVGQRSPPVPHTHNHDSCIPMIVRRRTGQQHSKKPRPPSMWGYTTASTLCHNSNRSDPNHTLSRSELMSLQVAHGPQPSEAPLSSSSEWVNQNTAPSTRQPHSEHRFPAPSSKLCQIWLRHWRGTLYLRAAVRKVRVLIRLWKQPSAQART